jgi:hypothetical protein
MQVFDDRFQGKMPDELTSEIKTTNVGSTVASSRNWIKISVEFEEASNFFLITNQTH